MEELTVTAQSLGSLFETTITPPAEIAAVDFQRKRRPPPVRPQGSLSAPNAWLPRANCTPDKQPTWPLSSRGSPSRSGESNLEPLTERYLRLSPHTARATPPSATRLRPDQWSVCYRCRRKDPAALRTGVAPRNEHQFTFLDAGSIRVAGIGSAMMEASATNISEMPNRKYTRG